MLAFMQHRTGPSFTPPALCAHSPLPPFLVLSHTPCLATHNAEAFDVTEIVSVCQQVCTALLEMRRHVCVPQRAVVVVVVVASAVPACHTHACAVGQGILHRDVKSPNVLVRQRGNMLDVKLTDFDTAMMLPPDMERRVPDSEEYAGTPNVRGSGMHSRRQQPHITTPTAHVCVCLLALWWHCSGWRLRCFTTACTLKSRTSFRLASCCMRC